MASYEFQFKGGVSRHGQQEIDKFLLFFVIRGVERPFYQLMSDSLILQQEAAKPNFVTSIQICKLFVSQQGFGVPKRYTSFYMKLLDGPRPDIEVKPFSLERTGFSFKGKVSFLKKSDVLKILSEESTSRKFVERQRTLPIDTLRSMIKVDRSELRKGLRHVRIGKQSKMDSAGSS